MARSPAFKPATRPGAAGPKPAPRKGGAPRGTPRRKPAAGGFLARRWAALSAGPSWIGVAVIVVVVLVVLPIVAAVLGDIWAIVLAALAGGFALGRATAR